jgi:transmembrane sensor
MDYRAYTVQELATDDLFRKWILHPTPEVNALWLKWLADHPEKSAVAAAARELVLSVYDIYKDDLSEEALQQEVAAIARLAEVRKDIEKFRIINLTSRPLWRVAAIFFFASALGLWLYKSQIRPSLPVKAGKETQTNNPMLVRKNVTSHEMTVLLSDNSVAMLSPGSTIRYPAHFAAHERKVVLTGEAFFDVAKNPDQPFLVYTNETVTKVLGTSFRVKALDQENTVTVLVKTGRVSVYPKTEFETLKTRPNSEIAVIVLDPNQQAVFDKKQNRLEKGMVSNRLLLSELSVQKDLTFDDKPVTQVFTALQEIYGVVIEYDPEKLAQCMISTQFSDESLKQRLNAICQAIGATYEMTDGKIVINSKGCSE